MYSSLKLSLSIFGLLAPTLGHSKPVPQRVIGVSGSPELVCSLTAADRTTWDNSGASVFLDNFVREQGVRNWANNLDQRTTAGGTIADSNLDCTDLRTGNCRSPNVLCTQFTPPQVSFIRNAMFTCHSLLRAYQEELQDAIINEILMAGGLVSDFGQPAEQGYSIFGVLAGAFTIAAAAGAANPLIGGPLTAVAGIFGILGSFPDPTDADNLRNDIDARLAQAFTASRDQVSNLAQTIFGGVDDTSLLARISPPATNSETTDVGRFFSGGRFLIPATVNLDMEVRTVADRGIRLVRQALVIRALKTQGYFVWIDTGATTFEACTPTGSRFMNGKCYKIARFASSLQSRIEDIPADTVLKFGNEQYNIVIEDFYNNAEACQNANPNSDGQAQFEGLPLDGTLPQCFFNMRVRTGMRCILCQISNCGEFILNQCP
ncbi:hypothetical protein EYR41_004292 [Orbilia oligospora]|uniref:Cyanovirin-N domain-containing protein n=1 Tax=Orbilia oligospora TaxID=2813651 RepID=A0A8H2HV59_ORBOL|nr:hypothetical protein EYR41_004292 [Orbilia oligospora]